MTTRLNIEKPTAVYSEYLFILLKLPLITCRLLMCHGLRFGMTGVLALTLTLLPATTAQVQAQISELPTLGEAAADDLSPSNERKLGEAMMRQVVRDPSYLSDPESTEYLNALGYKLVAASPAKHQDFTFFFVRDPMINAFAMFGGYIGVHTGLMLTAQSESELASVMAHEIGHVAQRHLARLVAKQKESTAMAIGALLLAVLAARSNSSSSGDLTQAAILGGQAAAMQQQLNFSREAEREADRIGLSILVDAGFDSRDMASFFGRMQTGSRIYESAAPAYLRTHPLPTERIADIQTRVRETRTKQRADSLEFHLIRARLKVLQDNSVQAAQDALTHFEHQLNTRSAASEAAAQYGIAVAALRLNQPQRAQEAALNARKLTRQPVPMLDKVVSEARYYAARNADERAAAVQLAKEAAVRFPMSRVTTLHYVELLQREQQHDSAINFLREQLALPRSESTYYAMLAKSYAALNRRTLHHQAVAEAYALLGATPAAVEQLQLARKAADADFYVLSEVDARLRQLAQELKEQRDDGGRTASRRPAPEDERNK